MSDQSQTETGSLAVPAERASAFAVNIGNLLTKGNPEQSIGEAMDALVSQRVDWENNELASANDALYALLQHCYSLNNAMSGTGVASILQSTDEQKQCCIHHDHKPFERIGSGRSKP